ncbi:RNA-binding S4 domain-containing protein [Chitinophaga sancti]|uniref:RNA-binding S4 domain-containing protein n=1 Tax=Chitinophaga sancti TaxID=1004 RepID=A0A1K1SW98_9BACT|nr:RNA-binding S4 domain-containing protein [Chitinophaga sancti]WQD61099.1 RNA-binding S4 domain-containing protein [Chitinophaga sancti]WQG86772.1 RNA-binding S4 domain-containing protein [Chitinophaga sancti]SFW88508.1 ribosome-associated heat shock protein Hsp15 [Chitinophaga sancti]
MQNTEKLRLDKYLWAIRIFKTRSQAATACDGGKVKMNGNNVKAARSVGIGDKYEIRSESRKWVIEVVSLLANRVQYAEAIKHYVDLTPEEDQQAIQRTASSFHTGKRPSKIGRPTKKERRDLDGFMAPEDEE